MQWTKSQQPLGRTATLERRAANNPVAPLVLALVLMTLVAGLVYGTGYQLRFAVLYLVPIALATWTGGWRAGVLIVALSSLSWLMSFRTTHPYSGELFFYWEDGVMMAVYLAFVVLLARLRVALVRAGEVNRRLTQEIQEREQAEAEVRRLNESLEERVAQRTRELTRANRNLERFSYSIAHDLRTPLRAIHGFASILEETLLDPSTDAPHESLDRIKANAVRMADLIDDILTFSRLSRAEMQFQRVDMEALARQSLARMASSYPSALQVRIAPLPAADGDPSLLECVFDNLISNALKFSCTREHPLVEVGAEAGAAEETIFFVRDNGVGFDMDFMARLFDPFVRLHTSEEFPGTGVGLGIVKNVIERHNGRVWAQAVPNQGAKFCFTLSTTRSALDIQKAKLTAEP
jgi:signal transduction histidine kinase